LIKKKGLKEFLITYQQNLRYKRNKETNRKTFGILIRKGKTITKSEEKRVVNILFVCRVSHKLIC